MEEIGTPGLCNNLRDTMLSVSSDDLKRIKITSSGIQFSQYCCKIVAVHRFSVFYTHHVLCGLFRPPPTASQTAISNVAALASYDLSVFKWLLTRGWDIVLN